MNFFEEQVARYERRVSKIQEGGDPKRLRCNKIRAELERDLMQENLQWWKAGKPFCASPLANRFLKALGVEDLNVFIAGQKTLHAPELLRAVGAAGFQEDSCDMVLAGLGTCLQGHMPPPDFILSWSGGCMASQAALKSISLWFGKPMYSIDIPPGPNAENLRCVADQLGEAMEFAERTVPGVKFDQDKLIELQQVDALAMNYLHETYELRKHKPSPIAGKDALRGLGLASQYPDPWKALSFYREFRDEIGERVARGVGVVQEEKLRLLWTVGFPYFTDPFDFLEKRGVVMPFYLAGGIARFYGIRQGPVVYDAPFGDEKEYGRKLSPLEEEARMLLGQEWWGEGKRWIDTILYVARDMGCDAIVNFLQRRCVPTIGLAKLIAESAEKELGIPTLNIQGVLVASEGFDEQSFFGELEGFVEMCMDIKGGV